MRVDSFKNGAMMPNKFAFCVPAAQGHTTGRSNVNPTKDFDGPAAQEAMKGKILAQGEELGLFTQNPAKGAKASQ